MKKCSRNIFLKVLENSQKISRKWGFILVIVHSFRVQFGVMHIWRPLWGNVGEGSKQKWDVIGRRGWGISECSASPVFIFLLKKIGFSPWQDVMLSQTIYYWQDIFPLTLTSDCETSFNNTIIQLHCLWAKSLYYAWSIIMWRVNWFCFSFDFVDMHGAIVVP